MEKQDPCCFRNLKKGNSLRQTPDTLVIALYPISSGYYAKLINLLAGAADFKLVSDLRKAGWIGLLKHLIFSRYRRVVIPYEVAEAKSVISGLILLAAAHKLPKICVCNPNCEIQSIKIASILEGALGMAVATFDGWTQRRRSTWAARRNALAGQKSAKSVSPGSQRVLYLKNNLWFGLRAGGSVGHVAGIVNGLVELGHAVRFVSPESPKYLVPKVKADRVPLFKHYALPAEANLFRLQRSARQTAVAVAREFHPTIIYQRLSLGDWTGVEVARKLGLSLVVEYNGSELWIAHNWGSKICFADDMRAAEDAMLRCADLVFTISKPLADELLGRGIPPARVAWYPNGVDPIAYSAERFSIEERASMRSKLGAGPNEFVVMFVGTFGQWHGAEVFAKAAVQIAEKSPELPLRFLFVGDGKTKPACVDLIDASRAARERTVFAGLIPQHETPAYLAAADAFVAPHVPNADGSKFFGSPTKLFEYMAMGKPIVASALDQIADVLIDGQTALLVRPGDSEDLAKGIGRLVKDRELGRRLGEAARAEVVRSYTWTRHVQEIMSALYRADSASC